MAIMLNFRQYFDAYLLLFVFGLTFFFTNFGPNTTTFIYPSEIFPLSVRTTCHGMSAALGKVGAGLGSFCFPLLERNIGLTNIMWICAIVTIMGLICTILFVPKDPPRSNSTTS